MAGNTYLQAKRKRRPRGITKTYITRNRALKKLQLPLSDFRKLCILKGIFPRNPSKKKEGSDKTYYLRKDIDYLSHEKLITNFRNHKAHQKKIMKAGMKKEKTKLRVLKRNRPRYTLEHIVLERYPNFIDALNELDDILCLIILFSQMPGDLRYGIRARRIQNCKRLMTEFLNYVVISHGLKKAFISIKGYYYQAEVMGQTLTWVSPHRFTQELPGDVDYSVMLTFLELYECILNFVNFRLYTERGLVYPPVFNRVDDAKGRDLDSVRVERVESFKDSSLGKKVVDSDEKKAVAVEDVTAATSIAEKLAGEEEEDDEEKEEAAAIANNPDLEDLNEAIKKEEQKEIESLLFYGKKFVLSRETPIHELEFVIRCFGGAILLDSDVFNSDNQDEILRDVTHWVLDRPAFTGKKRVTIEYVQPQYVFDCVNTSLLLPPKLYKPGAKLPPHLSPFENNTNEEGYKPWFQEFVERMKAGDESLSAEAAVVAYRQQMEKENRDTASEENVLNVVDRSEGQSAGEDAEETDDDEEAQEDRSKSANVEAEKIENIELKKSMMSKRKRRLYNSAKHKEGVLLAKRRRLEKKREALGMYSGKTKKARS